MKKKFQYIVFYLFKILPTKLSILILLASNLTFAAVDPKISWETLTTDHFEIIYDARQYQTARMYALRLELNHKLLSTYFLESPAKTIVVINDSTDMANGYATYIPYPHIVLYPVLPVSHDTISEYDDWPQELTLHEYAHILNFEPAHGAMKALRYLMGSVITPTMLLPRWWHEGIAVEMETRFSSKGRLRSVFQDATLRALYKEDLLSQFTIADINETDLDSWPRGARPYLFGSILMSEILAENTQSIGNDLLQKYSGRIPYFINSPVEEKTGKEFSGWFSKTLERIKFQAQNQLSKIHQQEVSSFDILDDTSLESHSPQLSPNGRFMTLVLRNHWGKSSIKILDRHEEGRIFDLKKDAFSEFLSIDNQDGKNPSKDAPPAGNINRVTWLEDSSGFIFDQIRYIDSYSNFSDLYFYDLNTQKNKRLTTGKRLREPTVSQNAGLIAAIQLEQSNTKLVTLNLEGDNLQILYTPPPFHKVSNPLFLNQEFILFTERDLQGKNQVKKINITNQSVEKINQIEIQNIDSLNKENDGISFVGKQNGLMNFYITKDEFKTYQRLTHTETAVFDGVIDYRMGLIYSTIMTGTGVKIASTELPNSDLGITPIIPILHEDRYNNQKSETPSNEVLESEFGSKIKSQKNYDSSRYLLPRYWLPFVYFTEKGYGTQVSTSAFDPLQKHSYSIQAGYDSFSKESNLGLNYSNSTTTWPFSISSNILDRKQPFLDSTFRSKQISLITNHDMRPLCEDCVFGLGLDSMEMSMSKSIRRAGPLMFFQYDGAAKSTYSPIPFSGFQLSLVGASYLKTEELIHLNRGILNGTIYFSKYLPERHIALIHLQSQQMQGTIYTSDLVKSEPYSLSQNLLATSFVLRGYDSGYFYFKTAHSASIEYHLPLTSYKGWNTLPIFLKKTRLNFYAEALKIDGISLNSTTDSYSKTLLDQVFSSYGIELKGDFSLGYYFPITGLIGIYHRPEYSGENKTTAFLGFQL